MAIIKNTDGDGWIDTETFITIPYLHPNFGLHFQPQHPLTENGEYDQRDFFALHFEGICQLSPESFRELERAVEACRADRDKSEAEGKGWVSQFKWEPTPVVLPEGGDAKSN